MLNSFKFEGFVLGQKEYKEKDKLILIFDSSGKKYYALGKGVRNLKSKRGGIVETANLIKGTIFKKGDYKIIGDIDLVWSPYKTKNSLILSAGIIYILELINILIPQEEENLEAYRLLEKTIFAFEKTKKLENIIHFEVQLLKLSGYSIPESVRIEIENNNLKKAQRILKKIIENVTEKKLEGMAVYFK